MNIPRPEYPRPQMIREKWMNLNGVWEFEIDHSKSGRARKLFEAANLNTSIIVPFCPESKLSGLEHKDFMDAVWYRKDFQLPEGWQEGRVLLHFGAVDYNTEVWVNGSSVGTHTGGYISFSFDITKYLRDGLNTIAVCAEDDVRSGNQPSGKQSPDYDSSGCMYTRTTGIWQTVWLETVPMEYISNIKYTPDPDNRCIKIEATLKGITAEHLLIAETSYNGKSTGTSQIQVHGSYASMSVDLSELHLWEPGNGRLYDLKISLIKNGTPIDCIESYFGMRSIILRDNMVLINGKPVFQRLVLDQGFYPDGIYTAPSDLDLKKDIEISMDLGFNGARLHEKIFEPRFLYWADKLGYLTWGEHANWGLDIARPRALEVFLTEWLEAVERDYSHPSIIGWCPFNETQQNQDDEVIRMVYRTTKMLDPTRPVIDTSGWHHVETDMEDIHDYEQNPVLFAERFQPLLDNKGIRGIYKDTEYSSQVNFVSEYGGTWWNPNGGEGWGYGNNPTTKEEFYERYKGLTEVLLNHPKMCAFCYTQLYDVEQEVNGLYTYDRKPKFDNSFFKKVNTQLSAIEKNYGCENIN